MYAFDRVLVDPSGTIVRRLQPGEHVRMPGHRGRHAPTEDKSKLDAVRYIFQRFSEADIGLRGIALELNRLGYPGPTGNGWSVGALNRILKNPVYCGGYRWGAVAGGRYHNAQGDAIVTSSGDRRCKPAEDTIQVDGVCEAIISPKLFDQVQRKIARRSRNPSRARPAFPLKGLIVCEHCGNVLFGTTKTRRDRHGKLAYRYQEYLCSTYQRSRGCGHHRLPAKAVHNWLAKALQQVFLGPGRDELVREIKRQLKSTAKTGKADTMRLGKRLDELDQEVGRLVKAIRTIDAPELARELADARTERDQVKAELARIASHTDPDDAQREAERVADTMRKLGERLSDADPAILRELFQRMVSRIVCRWDTQRPATIPPFRR